MCRNRRSKPHCGRHTRPFASSYSPLEPTHTTTLQQMKALLVCAHPRSDSFNAGIVAAITERLDHLGVETIIHDLYKDDFPPVLSAEESLVARGDGARPAVDMAIRRCQQDLVTTDLLVVVHPDWWGMPPANLVGWIDRVLAPNVAYKLEAGAASEPEALLDFHALVITTGDTEPARERSVFGDPLETIWCRCILPYVGATRFERLHLTPVHGVDDETRAMWIAECVGKVDALCLELRSRG
jgi:putative NADPH-quinone reductase